MKKDRNFKCENQICNFRAAGVLIRDGKILVQRDKDGSEYALPGGQVVIGETSVEPLIREYKEETEADIICKRLLWIEECFWNRNDTNTHTLTFYYFIELADNEQISVLGGFVPQKDNDNVVFGWIPLDKLNHITIFPAFIKREIFNLEEPCKHFITKESC